MSLYLNNCKQKIQRGLKRMVHYIREHIFFISLLVSFVFHLWVVQQHLTVKKASKNISQAAKTVRIIFKNADTEKMQVAVDEPVKKTEKIKQQIVNNEIDPMKINNTSIKNKFLGEKDQAYDRQTIARNIGKFKRAGKGSPSADEQRQESQTVQFNNIFANRFKSEVQEIKKGDTRYDKRYMKNNFLQERNVLDNKITQQKTSSPQSGIDFGDMNFSGPAFNNDHVDDIPLGDFTKLNTKEFKYYGYYFRIRQQLEQYWGGSLKDKAEQLYRSGRRLPASENMITSLVVKIDPLGNILDIYIKSTSGVKELDDAAVESFNKAGPFPNPPKGMLKGDVVTIEWGFVVKG